MEVPGKNITIYSDDEFLCQIDAYAKKEGLSRSLAIRQIVTDFFSRGGLDARE